MSTTASTSDMKTLSITDIERAMRVIDLLPKNKEWLLVDPNGNCWKTDDVAKLIGILAAHHPFLKISPLSDFTFTEQKGASHE